jgi:hypothetical protein
LITRILLWRRSHSWVNSRYLTTLALTWVTIPHIRIVSRILIPWIMWSNITRPLHRWSSSCHVGAYWSDIGTYWSNMRTSRSLLIPRIQKYLRWGRCLDISNSIRWSLHSLVRSL